MFSPVLFRIGVLYERLTALRALRSLRGLILCVFEKEKGASVAGTELRRSTVEGHAGAVSAHSR